MPGTGRKSPLDRAPLSRERVLNGAVAVADATGIAGLTIRSLAQELGVKPMSVYHHVANKEQILDGIVDIVFSEIELPSASGDWRPEISRRAHSARVVLRRHPWAIGLLETRTSPGYATLRHHNAVLGALPCRGLLGGADRSRLRAARQLRLRVRAAGGHVALQRPERRGGCRTDDGGCSSRGTTRT